MIHQKLKGFSTKLAWLDWMLTRLLTRPPCVAARVVWFTMHVWASTDSTQWTESIAHGGPVTQRRGTGLSWPSTSDLTAQACTGAAGHRGRSIGWLRHCCRWPELVGDHWYGDSGHPRPSRGHLRVARGLTNSTGRKTRTGSTSGRGLPRWHHGQDEQKLP